MSLIACLLLLGASLARAETTHFVFIKIPDSVEPVERGAKYEEPLHKALRDAGVGEITGGGSMLSGPDPDGTRRIEWVGVDADLTDLDRGLAVLKRKLRQLGAPLGTTLEYERGGRQHELRLGPGGWTSPG